MSNREQETRLAAPRSCPRRAMLLVPVGRSPVACARSRRGRRVPAPTARAMGAGLPRLRRTPAFRAPGGRKKRDMLHPSHPPAGPLARTIPQEVRRARGPSECIRIARLRRAGGEFAPKRKHSLHVSPAAPKAQGKRATPAEKIGASRAFPTPAVRRGFSAALIAVCRSSPRCPR